MFSTSLLLLLIVLLLSPLISSQSRKDDTIVEGSVGKDVTESVVKRIRQSGIFKEDSSFLLRLAYLESKFGENDTTFRPSYYGGIWQLDENLFRMTTLNTTTLAPYHNEIRTKFDIDWLSVSWTDLVKPLYSGLGARLFFARVPPMPHIPDTIKGQARHWKDFYRPKGNIEDFIEAAEELRNQTRCRGKMDLCVVLDGSGSVSIPDFADATQFVSSMISSFTLDYSRIGMVVYSTDPVTIFPVANNHTIEQLAAIAGNATQPRGGTQTGLAMIQGVGLLQSANATDGIPQLMMVFTDGKSNSPVTPGVEAARVNNITTFGIGVGSGAVRAELLEISQNRTVFELTDFDALTDFIFQLTSITCELPQRPIINETYNDSLVRNERRYYSLELPPAGITVSVHVAEGKVRGYWSYTEEAPNGAVHDGVIDGPTHVPGRPAEMPRFGLGRRDSKLARNEVYISIEGAEENNNYQIETQEGNQAPPPPPPETYRPPLTGGAGITSPTSLFLTFQTLQILSAFII